jgi:hypothetical protein
MGASAGLLRVPARRGQVQPRDHLPRHRAVDEPTVVFPPFRDTLARLSQPLARARLVVVPAKADKTAPVTSPAKPGGGSAAPISSVIPRCRGPAAVLVMLVANRPRP